MGLVILDRGLARLVWSYYYLFEDLLEVDLDEGVVRSKLPVEELVAILLRDVVDTKESLWECLRDLRDCEDREARRASPSDNTPNPLQFVATRLVAGCPTLDLTHSSR